MSCARSSCTRGRGRILGLMAALIVLSAVGSITPWPYLVAVVAVEVVVVILLIAQAVTAVKGVR